MEAACSVHGGALSRLITWKAPIPMIATATTPVATNRAIGPQLRPWLTRTGASGLRPLPPPPAANLAGVVLVGVAFAGAAFVPVALVPVALAAVVFAPVVLAAVALAACAGVLLVPLRAAAFFTGSTPPSGASSTTSASGGSDAAVLADSFVLGRRTSPVLMLMRPRHVRLQN